MRFRTIIDRWRKDRALVDLVGAGAAAALLILLTFLMDISERVLSWIRANEDWQADKFLPSLTIVTVFLAFVSYRRWRDAVAEASGRRLYETELAKSEEKYRALFDSAIDAIMVVHVESDAIVQLNRKMYEGLGYTREEFLAVNYHDILAFGSPEDVQEIRENTWKHGIDSRELKLITKDGAVLEIQSIARMLTIHGEKHVQINFRDITERKKAEEELRQHRDHLDELVRARTSELSALNQKLLKQVEERARAQEELRESERHYRELFDSMREGVGLVDMNENILFCNPAYACIFEEDSVESLIGRNLKQYLPPEEIARVRAESARRQKGKASQYEVNIVAANGHRKTLLVSATPKFDDNNEVVGSHGAITDLTEMKRLQDLTSRAMRLETAGRVASQVAHDFNNLLGPMVAYPGLIRDELPEDHPVLDYVRDIEKSAHQIAEINQELLTLGRRGHYNQAPLNLNDLILQEIKRIQPIPETLSVKLDLEEDLANVKGGASQISRAILNLVTNAIDAMSEGGQLTITTEYYSTDDRSERVESLSEGEYVCLTIGDTGSGIPEDVLPRVMEPFFSTKSANKKRGSGLGLSVVHAVVEDHRGHVDIQSAIGQGTTIRLYLPVTAETCEETLNASIVGGKETILVVDDDEVQRKVASKLLAGLGYRVQTADAGEQALEVIQNQQPDLLILDMIMPEGMDGTETYRRVLELIPDQKAIIISGFAESERVEAVLRLGAGEFVKKPLTLQTMARAVRRELDSVRGTDKTPATT